MVGVVVPAAGRGSRFGSAENKIWVQIGARSVIEWTLAAFQAHPDVEAIVIAGAEEELERLRSVSARFGKVCAIVAGGASRQESVGNGLAALPARCDIVLVHDAARPAVSQQLISRIIALTTAQGAAIPGLPVSDTVKRVDEQGTVSGTVPREGLWSVQTPQGARAADLRAAYEKLGPRVAEATDEAGVLEAAGYPVRMVEGDPANLKVTRPGDLERAAEFLKSMGVWEYGSMGDHQVDIHSPTLPYSQTVRTGFGYDVHAFGEGRPLWLGGVQIPHDRGLAGHSDADVLLHALCDALLGAAAMGDIGVLFPDTDAAHKDRPSIEFLQEVRRLLAEDNWTIVNVDVALLAEEPRIGPFRPQMTAVIADGLQIAPTQVNIKATTSERMGFVGRQEGIACWVVATISGGVNT
jgi:2-C-methyl-D-erythritol 4-phosphate cytidylyltransferase / 2-C-methyl-D-erythritol 2,4-cyclodiphosphate synthase